MAGSVNKVILVGNLGRDPEIRSLQDGKEIANLTLATSESWKDRNTGERRERTEWHRIVIFNDGLVNLVKNYLHKGSKIYLEGQLQTRKYTDSQGVEKYSTEVVLQNYNSSLMMLDRPNQNQGGGNYEGGGYQQRNNQYAQSGGGSQQQPARAAAQNAELDDEIPF
jgi:single-strand DNA-binding protein